MPSYVKQHWDIENSSSPVRRISEILPYLKFEFQSCYAQFKSLFNQKHSSGLIQLIREVFFTLFPTLLATASLLGSTTFGFSFILFLGNSLRFSKCWRRSFPLLFFLPSTTATEMQTRTTKATARSFIMNYSSPQSLTKNSTFKMYDVQGIIYSHLWRRCSRKWMSPPRYVISSIRLLSFWGHRRIFY